MGQPVYTNEKLLELAKHNYSILKEVCHSLDREGYWDQPKSVLKHSIFEFLDLYVQSVLLNLAIYCGRLHEEEREFIIQLPDTNAIGCKTEEGLDDNEVLKIVKTILKSPPILLQLCGVHDVEKASHYTEEFYDSFLNILILMSHVNAARDNISNGFIQEYYDKIRVFINQGDAVENLSPRYIFKKLSNDKIGEAYCFAEEREKRQSVRLENVYKTGPKEKHETTDDMFDSPLKKSSKKTLHEQKCEEEESIEDASFAEDLIVDYVDEELKKRKDEILEDELSVTKPKTKLEEYLEELNQLVGLPNVKEEIKSLINLIKVRKLRESYQMPTMEMTYHMVFTGNPGTGKTTVARLVAKIYKELGILSKENLIETDRSGLVAGYVGQTAIKVKEVVESALGGILFIDEAYSLSSNVANDFGQEAIDTLVKLMEDHRDNLVIIVAGYKEEMKNFLDSNTGLVSRFNKFIEFEDYSVEELCEILASMADKVSVTLKEEAMNHVKSKIEGFSKEEFRLFGNARGIRNAFEKIMIAQANRLVLLDVPTKEQLCEIVLEDVLNVF